MRVLAVNQFYLPDHSATAQLLGELCEDLATAGHEVDVITSRGTYLGGQRLPRAETRGGVVVRRTFSTSLGKKSIAHRLADYATFWSSAIFRAMVSRKPNVVLALTTPPMIALGMAQVARARSVPLVTWNQDVYPETAAELGVLSRSGTAYRTLQRMARRTHQLATRVIALSQGMADRLLEEGAGADKVRVIPNWADGRLIRPLSPSENPFRWKNGFEGRFLVMYSGNIGAGHDVETLLGAAAILARTLPEALLVFVGDGARRHQAERLAEGAANVRFLPYQPKAELAASLSAADVHLVSLRAGLEGLLVPSKLYGILASGRPVCYIGPPTCEGAKVVRDNDLGWEGRNGDEAGLAQAVAKLAKDGIRWDSICRRARAVFEAHYDRPICVGRWLDTLTEVL